MNFDPAAYLDLPIDNALTRRPPLTAGDYTAIISDLTARQWQSKDKYVEGTSILKGGIAYDVMLAVQIPQEEATRLGLTKPELTIKDGIMLDLTPSGSIDDSPGKNTRLRMYRDALDMNKAGETFRARQMVGKLLKVRISHDTLPSGDLTERVGALSRV